MKGLQSALYMAIWIGLGVYMHFFLDDWVPSEGDPALLILLTVPIFLSLIALAVVLPVASLFVALREMGVFGGGDTTLCAAADPVDCNKKTNTNYMMLSGFHDYKVWGWVPLCERHAPPDGCRFWPTEVES